MIRTIFDDIITFKAFLKAEAYNYVCSAFALKLIEDL
jgi:hypothetical protein